MAYNSFAYWYDRLNDDVDYDRLHAEIQAQLKAYGVNGGIVADLGCGTGELTLRLGKAGYDMIAVDNSSDMLTILREKQADQGQADILVLCQDLQRLDLYGTIRAAVSTFDTFNHLPEASLREALKRVALFTENDGVLIFDINTPYKHERVLGDNIFEATLDEDPNLILEWENRYDCGSRSTLLTLTMWNGDEPLFSESFKEYSYDLDEIAQMLDEAGYSVAQVVDGETFEAPTAISQRLMITAVKDKMGI